jgi:hypothetical protein
MGKYLYVWPNLMCGNFVMSELSLGKRKFLLIKFASNGALRLLVQIFPHIRTGARYGEISVRVAEPKVWKFPHFHWT